MPIEKWSESVVVVHLADDPQFTEDMEAYEQLISPHRSGVIDFAGIHFINSSNIARLLRVRRHVYETGGKLICCDVRNRVWATFLMTGLDKVFEFSENVTTALATIQMHKSGGAGD